MKSLFLVVLTVMVVSCSHRAKRGVASGDSPQEQYLIAIDERQNWDCSYAFSHAFTVQWGCSCEENPTDVIIKYFNKERVMSGATNHEILINRMYAQLKPKYNEQCKVRIDKILTRMEDDTTEEIANSSSRIKNDIISDPELLDAIAKQLEKRKK